MLVEIVGDKIAKIVGDEKNILELRLRIGRPLVVCSKEGKRVANYNGVTSARSLPSASLTLPTNSDKFSS